MDLQDVQGVRATVHRHAGRHACNCAYDGNSARECVGHVGTVGEPGDEHAVRGETRLVGHRADQLPDEQDVIGADAVTSRKVPAFVVPGRGGNSEAGRDPGARKLCVAIDPCRRAVESVEQDDQRTRC